MNLSRNSRSSIAPGIALGIAMLTPPVSAQQTSDEIVVTAQRKNQTEVTLGGDLGILGNKPAEDVPFSIRSYNEALILNQQPQTLGQVLENDPTVRTSYGFGNASEQFVVRGFPLFGDDVGLNGLYGISPRQLVAPELFESVQVLNGASAFLNGAAPGGSGVGGSVNLKLKRARSVQLSRTTLGYTSSSHFGGSVDVARRFGTGSEFGVRVNGAYRSGDVAINDEFRRSAVAGAAFDWRGNRTRISLDIGYQNVEVRGLRPKVTIGTTAIPAVPKPDQNYAQPWTYTKLRDVFGIARVEYDLADNALFYATAGARDGSERGIYGGIQVTDAITGDANGNALFVPRTDNNEAAEAGIRVKLSSRITHEFNLGTNIIWQTNRNAFDFLYGPGFAGFATNIYDTPLAAIPASAFVGGDLDDPFPISRSRLWSAYASDTISAFDDQIMLTAGLRLQSIRVKTYSAYNGGLLDMVYDENAVTPLLGLVIKPAPGISLFANRIEALQQGPTAPLDPVLVNAGDVFAPFKSVQYEIGGKMRIGTVDASLSLFQIARPSAFAVPVDPALPAGQQQFGLFGEQRNRGAELTLAVQPVKGMRLIGGASLIKAKFRKTAGGVNEGNTAPGVPKFTANANAELDLPFVSGLTLTGRAVYTGGQLVDAANTLKIRDWTRIDLGARYVLVAAQTPVTLRFTVDNVANTRYWASAFDSFNAALLQGQPRTFKASISADF
jgi:iron complex outermembrane recepter protein